MRQDLMCKVCHVVKVRIRIGPPEKALRYVDDNGKRWNGHVCSSCFNNAQRGRDVRSYAALVEQRNKRKERIRARLREEAQKVKEIAEKRAAAQLREAAIFDEECKRFSKPVKHSRKCQVCGTNTKNYFRCAACWTHLDTSCTWLEESAGVNFNG